MHPALRVAASLVLGVFLISGCDSQTKDLFDLATNPPDRKPINVDKMGINNFFINPEFGTASAQFREIRDTLGIYRVRVLFAWTDGVQPSPSADPFFGFYDQIVDA
ncbi:MAG: hypothetical protein KDD44_04670, partial [Bdellovibrionales bacterium]|nr:hypothetical protein [Bdellovibrionales bacterium]